MGLIAQTKRSNPLLTNTVCGGWSADVVMLKRKICDSVAEEEEPLSFNKPNEEACK